MPRFTKTNFQNSLKVLAWSVGSATIGAIIVWLGEIEIAEQYLFIVPTVNVILYTLKEWFDRSR